MAMLSSVLTRSVCVVVVVAVMVKMGYSSSVNAVERADGPVDKEETVSLLWGIADTTASVGRLFRYHLSGDAFQGHVARYEVVEAGKTTLPSWLHFDSSQNVLQGIPSAVDSGQLYLEVTAHGAHGNKVSDVFSVSISPDTPAMSSGQPLKFQRAGPEMVRCKREEPETVATIVVDADLDGMPVQGRLEMLKRFLGHMGLSEEMVKVVPAKAKLLQDDTALVTGVGDVVDPRFPGVALSWLVGCGKVETGHFPVLHKLDDDSRSGEMVKALGHSVVGWRVTNTRLQQHVLKRRRRQVMATPTPVLTMAPPTTAGPAVVTTPDSESMTREVVDMTSPTYTIDPTPAQTPMPKTTTPHMPDVTEKPMKKTTLSPVMEACERPSLDNPFERLNFFVGDIIDHKIPANVFSVCGEGDTRDTKLSLFRDKIMPLPEGWFLQFDQKTQTLRGMAMKSDIGTYNMHLVSMLKTRPDTQGFNFRIAVRKHKGKKAKVTHEMSMTIDTDYDEFMASVDKKVDLANKVASVFGDDNASALTVTGIARGSVLYVFTNNSLSGGSCRVDAISGLADKLASEDGTLNPEAQEKLKPWVLTGVAVTPAGDCKGNSEFPVRSASVVMTTGKPVQPDGTDASGGTDAPGVPDKEDKKSSTAAPEVTSPVASAGKTSDDNIWITTVVPAVVIVAILLIALLVACILYRKKRKGKMNMEDQNTFVNRGAPVIFPDELDEKPGDSTKPLLIEGSPPAPPPEYHRGDSESSDPGNPHKEATPPSTDEVDAEIEIDATSPLYQPPPPVTASSGKQARPHVQQPYRSQPPEIHP